MNQNDQAIEQEIVAKGKTAPRVTFSDIEANIASTHYFTALQGVIGQQYADSADGEDVTGAPAALGLLTFCVLVLQNGFTVTGESACASAENFDAEIGRKIARESAVQKIRPLMGYALKQKLHDEACEHALLHGELATTDGGRAWTFNEFLQYGRDNGANIVRGMPWSFHFHGHPVTHENDQCYLIMGAPGHDLRFTPEQVITVNPDGSLALLRADPLPA